MAASHSQDQLLRNLAAGKLRLAQSSSSFTLSDEPSVRLTRTPADMGGSLVAGVVACAAPERGDLCGHAHG
jgi:hypothetical protein